ncbi:hypothetical protein EEL40_13985 [Muribaculaceae bacterium Isolate-083 (Janvier)]|nr:hypothetical protein EEL37_13360 [Muribaculaceae bacterium Isolate-077 (Janvier)]ROS94260.1 hypothetical protein EEL40_13985 [Muribaculaceae bacterium Isolate-083 (Janvier)]ROS96697.1 hypothetical protein EEL41_13360 [Muribaculaceae bacterium Isolate-084 (Janvier)]
MEAKEIYKRLWQTPDGHTYFGWFSDNYHDHLFDVSKLIMLLYDTTTTKELAEDIDKLVIEYFLEATKNDECWVPEPKKMFEVAEPPAWFANRLRKCIVTNSELIDDYKKAMNLPDETLEESYNRHKYMNTPRK